jgi:hypothetical protein
MYLMPEKKGLTCGLPSLFCNVEYNLARCDGNMNGVMSEWSKEID